MGGVTLVILVMEANGGRSGCAQKYLDYFVLCYEEWHEGGGSQGVSATPIFYVSLANSRDFYKNRIYPKTTDVIIAHIVIMIKIADFRGTRPTTF